MTGPAAGPSITVRFALPREELRPFVTTYYYTEARCSKREPVLEDYLHPEWPNLRFIAANPCESAIGAEDLRPVPAFAATGPTSRPTRFRLGSGRMWGIGLMPLGWAALVEAQAGDYADRFVDGEADPAFAAFHPLARELAGGETGFAEGLALIEAHMDRVLAAREAGRAADHAAIRAVNAALVDPELASVAELAERVGMNVRSLERLARRAFGFTPKLLLRRQRFLRSLAQFMLDPSLKWLEALDCQYHDQAHFVRDFKRFMGMNPSVYARLDKPFLVAAARARMEIAGAAVQGLHRPESSS
ncbi:AraC family transcriptional regulator [Erythrobacter sp.]|uniref:helix-turn-helix domain-containing protein n=1 Tax=Erythrobacter sp. TaxID=1042 RepID=UPI001425CCC2|nr:helix-turn-helix domain-containing protein [Erythrobacter sp.]QIQ87676.1 MAG: AraC family transcriptional regulator [Erythrobacter sp.]